MKDWREHFLRRMTHQYAYYTRNKASTRLNYNNWSYVVAEKMLESLRYEAFESTIGTEQDKARAARGFNTVGLYQGETGHYIQEWWDKWPEISAKQAEV